jgi:hypothetical protein
MEVHFTPQQEAQLAQQFEAKLAALRIAIDQGDVSGAALGDSFQHVRQTLKLSKRES